MEEDNEEDEGMRSIELGEQASPIGAFLPSEQAGP